MIKQFFFFLLLSLCSVFSAACFAQEVNTHIFLHSIYDYLDELASEHVIELNTAVKPYSRKFIAGKLQEAEIKKNKLTKRQLKDLLFFLRDYGKEVYPDKKYKKRLDLLYYKDSLFSFTLNPVLGYSYYTNKNGFVTHRWNGAEASGYAGNRFGFYVSLRDNGVSDVLFAREYLTQMQGANYKSDQGQNDKRKDFSEARGGLSYGWKWGSLSLVKDHFVWGNNYNGANIFSGRQPSFAYIHFKMHPVKWFDFNYVHGWMVSQEIDSLRTYGNGSGLRKIFYPKYLAANFLTVTPLRNFNFSFGNSIVYSDKQVQPAYLIPFMFYKSVDHTMNGAGSNALGENSQLFFDISSRNIPKTHIYVTLFTDEVSISNITNKQKQTNLFSFKGGVRIINLIVPNVSFTAEYTRTNPWTYTHPIATTTFESNKYNLGHYLRENSDEIFLAVKLKPYRGLAIEAGYIHARKGTVLAYQQVNGVNNVAGTPFMKAVEWTNKTAFFKAQYEIINDAFVFAEYSSSAIQGTGVYQYSPSFYFGNPNTINIGMNVGF